MKYLTKLSGRIKSSFKWSSRLFRRHRKLEKQLFNVRPRMIYAIHTQFYGSSRHGDYIGYHNLMRLYGLRQSQCIRWDDLEPWTLQGRRYEDYVHCWPRRNDNYPVFDN